MIRILLVIAGFIASIFIGREELHFDVVQMVVGVLLFTLLVFVLAFWGDLRRWFRGRRK